MSLAAANVVEQNRQDLIELSRALWHEPEVGFEEVRSARRLAAFLESRGFAVERGTAGLPTAFTASWSRGTGGPVIGILGEYDALPGLSQELKPEKSPVEPGGPGHGCGHNLLGVAGIGAVLAVKEVMEQEGLSGTIRYYGCPAEELLVGKVFMVRAGVFADLDAALTWHPGSINAVSEGSSSALNSVRFRFEGVAAHAGSSPQDGRSALDAVELMNVGANYLREHVPPDTRIHYSITDGGDAPNIVPATAEVWYFVRAEERSGVESVYRRLRKIAEGAALMTETTMHEQFVAGCYPYLHNGPLGQLLHASMEAIGAPQFADGEVELGRQLQETVPPEQRWASVVRRGYDPSLAESVLHDALEALTGEGPTSGGSTDVGDVSWVVPLAQFTTACAPIGTPGHSWQNVVAVGSGIGMKGMLFAAGIMAETSARLLREPEQLGSVQDAFNESTARRSYRSPLPDDMEKPV